VEIPAETKRLGVSRAAAPKSETNYPANSAPAQSLSPLAFLLCNTFWHYIFHYKLCPGRADSSREMLLWSAGLGGARTMTVFDKHRDELEHYETMMGPHRGRLAVTLDLLTNAMVLIGQHGVYCRSSANPNQPPLDMRLINDELQNAKQLIQSVMENLRAERDARNAST
jgi:hypothetical protein